MKTVALLVARSPEVNLRQQRAFDDSTSVKIISQFLVSKFKVSIIIVWTCRKCPNTGSIIENTTY
jgi:hypothetical protein